MAYFQWGIDNASFIDLGSRDTHTTASNTFGFLMPLLNLVVIGWALIDGGGTIEDEAYGAQVGVGNMP